MAPGDEAIFKPADEAAAPEFDDTHFNEAQLNEAQLEAKAVADIRAEVEHQKEKDNMQAEQDEEGITAREAARVERDRKEEKRKEEQEKMGLENHQKKMLI